MAVNRQVPLTDASLDSVSLRVAGTIEDQFAQHHLGGRTQRLAKIQVIIRNAVLTATLGETHWNAWKPSGGGDVPTKPRTGT